MRSRASHAHGDRQSRLRDAVARTSDAKVTRPVAQLANLDLNLLVILRELIRERNVTRAAERVFAAETEFDPRTSNREFTLLMADYTLAVIGDRLSAFVEREAPNVRLHILLRGAPPAAAAEQIPRPPRASPPPPSRSCFPPRVGARGELPGGAVPHHRH